MSKSLGQHKTLILAALLVQGYVGMTSVEIDSRIPLNRKAHKALPELEKAGLVVRKYNAISGERETRGTMTAFGAPQVWLHKDFDTAARDAMAQQDAQFMSEIISVVDTVTEVARSQRPRMAVEDGLDAMTGGF